MKNKHKYDKLLLVKESGDNLNKKAQKIAVWVMLILMVASVIAGILVYTIGR